MDKNEVISAIKNLTLGDLAILFGSGQKEDSSQSVCVTKEELMSTKQILDKDDIMKLLNISKDKAYKIIRSINAYRIDQYSVVPTVYRCCYVGASFRIQRISFV